MARNELDHFFQQFFPIVRGKCARLLGDTEEAADVAQETFLRFCASPVVRESIAARLKWIYLTGTRLAIDHLRRRRLGIEVAAPDGTDAPASHGRADQVVAARQLLGRLAAEMPPAELEVLVMTRFDRMSQEEVAEVTAQVEPAGAPDPRAGRTTPGRAGGGPEMKTGAHLSFYALDRVRLGEPATAEEHDHLATCASCGAHVRPAAGDSGSLPAWLAEARLAAPGSGERRALRDRLRNRLKAWRAFWPALTAGAAAVAVAAGLLLVWPRAMQEEPRPGIREKGHPGVQVFVKRGERVFPWNGS